MWYIAKYLNCIFDFLLSEGVIGFTFTLLLLLLPCDFISRKTFIGAIKEMQKFHNVATLSIEIKIVELSLILCVVRVYDATQNVIQDTFDMCTEKPPTS